MNQIEVCTQYIKKQFAHFVQKEDNLFTFEEDGQTKSLCIIEEKENKLFSSEFQLLLSEQEEELKADYYAFCFGGQFYYVQDTKNPKLHILRYLGQYEINNEDFVHLGLHSTYSLLVGCQKIEAYIEKAKYLNMKALGICERKTLNSCIKFQSLCEANNIKSIIGEEIKVKIKDDCYNFKFFVKNKEGWNNLINISNIVNIFSKQEDKDYIVFQDLLEYLDNLVIIIPNNFPFDDYGIKLVKFDCYYQIDTVEYLNKDYYFDYLSNIKNYLESKWFNKYPCVLIGDSYYLDKEDKNLQEIVKKIGDYKEFEYAYRSRHFKSIEEHINIFSKFWKENIDKFDEIFGQAIQNTVEIANKCNFKIEFEKLHIPAAIIDEEDWNSVLNEEESYKN